MCGGSAKACAARILSDERHRFQVHRPCALYSRYYWYPRTSRHDCLLVTRQSGAHKAHSQRQTPSLVSKTGCLPTTGLFGSPRSIARVNDLIRTGGETVLATEVERVLVHHPEVAECAVFSLDDEKFGEAVCCALVSRRLEFSLVDIRSWCRECGLVAGYKQSRRVFHVGELPKNSSGKILKFLLKERFADQAAATLQSRL